MDKAILRKWLKAGFMKVEPCGRPRRERRKAESSRRCWPTSRWTGLEAVNFAKDRPRQPDKVHLVRYADDFIISGSSRELLEDEVKPLVADFLKTRGLELSPEKTSITHIDEGFDFLGWNVRKFGRHVTDKAVEEERADRSRQYPVTSGL